MYPAVIEDYFAPPTVAVALDLLERYGAEAKLLSGGQSLMPLLKGRLTEARYLVDLNRIGELSSIGQVTAGDGQWTLRIGALVRHEQLLSDPVVCARCSALADAAGGIGDVQVRNRGTIGGSLCYAYPGGDLAAPVLALGGSLRLQSKAGERRVAAEDFILGPMTTALSPNEVLVAVECPLSDAGSAYAKQTPVAGGFAIVGVAAALTVEAGTIRQARIFVGGVLPKPQRAIQAEQVLNGSIPSDAILKQAAEAMAGEVETHSDLAASAEYRKVLIRSLAPRVLARALSRIEGRARA